MNVHALVPVGVAALVPVVVFLRARLIENAQPMRMELAEKGERLLAQADLPKELRSQVTHMLDSAFGKGLLPFVVVAVFPFFVAYVSIFRPDMRARFQRDLSRLTGEQRALWDEVNSLNFTLRFVHHPIAQTVLAVEMVFMTIIVVLLSIVRPKTSVSPERLNTALNSLELGEVKLVRGKLVMS